MNISSIEETSLYLRLAETNWEKKQKHPHFQPIRGYPHIMLGHDEGKDIVALAPSSKPRSEWIQVTSAFETSVGPIDRFSGDWDNSLFIRFSSNDRDKIIPFVTELYTVSPIDIDGNFDETMSKWKAFFDRWGAPLSPEEQRGLFGELLVLEHLIEAGSSTRVRDWVGPEGKLHDFEGSEWHIEVKTSMKNDPTAMIHPLDQLDPHELPFNLVVVKIKPGEAITLPEKIAAMMAHEKICQIPDNLDHFNKMLKEIGYSKSDDHHYAYKYDIKHETIRLDVNNVETLLQSRGIDSKIRYDDIRWRLKASDHNFIPCSVDFWSDPTISASG